MGFPGALTKPTANSPALAPWWSASLAGRAPVSSARFQLADRQTDPGTALSSPRRFGPRAAEVAVRTDRLCPDALPRSRRVPLPPPLFQRPARSAQHPEAPDRVACEVHRHGDRVVAHVRPLTARLVTERAPPPEGSDVRSHVPTASRTVRPNSSSSSSAYGRVIHALPAAGSITPCRMRYVAVQYGRLDSAASSAGSVRRVIVGGFAPTGGAFRSDGRVDQVHRQQLFGHGRAVLLRDRGPLPDPRTDLREHPRDRGVGGRRRDPGRGPARTHREDPVSTSLERRDHPAQFPRPGPASRDGLVQRVSAGPALAGPPLQVPALPSIRSRTTAPGSSAGAKLTSEPLVCGNRGTPPPRRAAPDTAARPAPPRARGPSSC